MKKIQNNLKECALALVMLIIGASGGIASAGAFNWSKTEGWLFVVAGILNLCVTGFALYTFYKLYLKPDSKPQTLEEFQGEQKEANKKAK